MVSIARLLDMFRIDIRFMEPQVRPSSVCRTALKTFVMLTISLTGLVGVCTRAHAQSVICSGTPAVGSGTDIVVYGAPLKDTPQDMLLTILSSFSSCMVRGAPGITSATVDSQVQRKVSCDTPLAEGPGTQVINWSNGQTSTFSYSSRRTSVDGETFVTLLGNISDGLFKNQRAVSVFLLASPGESDYLKACSSTGLMSVSGPATLTIFQPT
ncbi:hypothetical protein AWB74_06511 [Caballeronia arvi]|uniref:Uncharacterized protein n=1 Tax=Caballeronia arvi TaxID=1777135 RepID=A0A158KQZ7_9BURK|nr:hypothetical protein [Caballeronia arvi]SAL83159.1 hypothetical protein AWB74_06511 [Caballeronia arvi]